ncbi:MAG TPA: tetratricopeptide repeat protein [Chitinolyticbacter sp.]|nr:tetratricopeptide repeat protein [Chitinolyticbacter sp.]
MQNNQELLQAEAAYKQGQYDQAWGLYQRLADVGVTDAYLLLGWMAQNGLGCEKDMDKAFQLYLAAGESGNSDGWYRAGKVMLSNGLSKEGYDLVEKAANLGYVPAIYRKAKLLLNGRGTQENRADALELYKMAAHKNHIFSLRDLGVILILGEDGFVGRFLGVWYYLKAFFLAIVYGAKDQFDERLQE